MSGSAKPRLLEREAELRELRAVFEGVPAGRGRLVVVEGAAGTGKSALTAAASGHGQGAGLRVHARARRRARARFCLRRHAPALRAGPRGGAC